MNLKVLITEVTGETPSLSSVKEFIFLCRKIASVQLKKKAHNGHLHLDFFNLSIDDLALDCVADLFQRDEQGTFIQIKAYFEGLLVHESTDEEILSHLRRLVFGKVNNGLFRIYNEHDPTLGKILRNIKLAIQALHNFEIIERFGESNIAPSLCETLEHLPQYERTQLESLLRFSIKGKENIPTILASLSHHLREQEEYSRFVPLLDIALVIRSIYSSSFEQPTSSFETENKQTENDTKIIIQDSCNQIRLEYFSKYVGKKKLPEFIYNNYFQVIEDNLILTILGNDGADYSYFEKLKTLIPELTKEEYQKNYKSQLEYLGRLTYERTITTLRKNL